MEKKYLLKGLDCPNCAAKIEHEVGELEGVSLACVNLMKQTLTVKSSLDMTKQIGAIVNSYEPDVEVSEYSEAHNHHEHGEGEGKSILLRLAVGAVIYVAGITIGSLTALPSTFETALLIIAYVILGGDVVLSAVRNILKGHIFDENFLMSLSSIGAFIIGEHYEAVAVMLFYQIGEFFQDMAVNHSRRSIADLMDIRPDSATVSRHGQLITISPEDVNAGETIVVKPGERIPLDGLVIDGESTLDTTALTGESVPRNIRAGDEALSGCINQSGVLTIRVTKAYGESTAQKIIDMVENASNRKAPTESFITKFARYYTPIIVITAVILAVIPPLVFDREWIEWIHRGFVFLVISCPCALVISIPLAFFGGIGAASKHGILVKGGNYLEALNNVSVVVFDKTGTLTKGVFNVTEIIPAGSFTDQQVLKYAAQAESYSNHPIAKSILTAYGESIDKNGISDYHEISGHGISVIADGKNILAGNDRMMNLKWIAYTQCNAIGTKVYVAVDGKFAGCILISDVIKPDSKRAIAQLKSFGVERCVMLTGDNKRIAGAVADELGLDAYHAELLPDQKVEKLAQLDKSKRAGSKLAFVGDGINDAPVLAQADVGIAMGGLGSDAAIEAADVVLMTDEPTKLIDAIKIARATKRIVVQNIVISLGIKGIFLILGACGIAGMWEAVFGDVGVALIAVFNAMRIMKE